MSTLPYLALAGGCLLVLFGAFGWHGPAQLRRRQAVRQRRQVEWQARRTIRRIEARYREAAAVALQRAARTTRPRDK